MMASNPYASSPQEHAYSRSRLISLSEDAELRAKPPGRPPRKAKTWWRWVRAYLRPKRRPSAYEKGADAGVAALRSINGGATTRVSVTGDWGSGSAAAGAVADAITKSEPDLTVHLGDIYRVGSENEVRFNFLGEGAAARWPTAPNGSAMAVPGNHEYGSGGHAFHELVLPELGIEGGENSQMRPQHTSYFCLENERWRIIGLDTGYHSVPPIGVALFVLVMSRLFKNWSWAQDLKTKLPAELSEWLRGILKADSKDPKGLIFFSHHQYISALDSRGDYPKPGKQISRMLNSVRRVLWIYGHEHRLAGYQLQARRGADNLEVYGRAVGIGSEADTIDLGSNKIDTLRLRDPKKPLDFVDNRKANPGGQVGYPGWADLIFTGPELRIDYHTVDLDLGTQEIVLTETFKADAGNVTRKQVVFALKDEDFLAPEEPSTG